MARARRSLPGSPSCPRVTTAARSRHPRERRDEGAEASHAGPADERPPADEASYAVQEARGPAAVNSVGPAAWAADLHAFGVALDPGASKVPLAAGTPPPSHPVGCFAASHSRIASAMKSWRSRPCSTQTRRTRCRSSRGTRAVSCTSGPARPATSGRRRLRRGTGVLASTRRDRAGNSCRHAASGGGTSSGSIGVTR